jgi:hypothetical protein
MDQLLPALSTGYHHVRGQEGWPLQNWAGKTGKVSRTYRLEPALHSGITVFVEDSAETLIPGKAIWREPVVPFERASKSMGRAGAPSEPLESPEQTSRTFGSSFRRSGLITGARSAACGSPSESATDRRCPTASSQLPARLTGLQASVLVGRSRCQRLQFFAALDAREAARVGPRRNLARGRSSSIEYALHASSDDLVGAASMRKNPELVML